MATRPERGLEQEYRGFYERARDRMRRALAELPSDAEIRMHRQEAIDAFREHERNVRLPYRPAYGSPSMYYEDDRQRLRRALAESPSPDEIRRHHDDAIAAFERYGRRR
jgi:formaldehyde-activating enzyme involved in methanogenesis